LGAILVVLSVPVLAAALAMLAGWSSNSAYSAQLLLHVACFDLSGALPAGRPARRGGHGGPFHAADRSMGALGATGAIHLFMAGLLCGITALVADVFGVCQVDH